MNKVEINRGTYKGIQYEISNWKLGDDPAWAYYIILPINQIPEVLHSHFILKPYESEFVSSKYVTFDYSDAKFVSELNWHCGITFYELIFDGMARTVAVKMGCDYSHFWDEKHKYLYNLDWIDKDCKKSIDKLWELVPNLKLRCNWNGRYYDSSEGKILENGTFLSNEGKKSKESFNSKI
jgi:hypothetical protein